MQLTEQLPCKASEEGVEEAEPRGAAAAEAGAKAAQETAPPSAPPAVMVSAAPADEAGPDDGRGAGLVADPNGFDAAMDAVIDNVPDLERVVERTGGAAGKLGG